MQGKKRLGILRTLLLVSIFTILITGITYLVISSTNANYTLYISNEEDKTSEIEVSIRKFMYIEFDNSIEKDVKITIFDQNNTNLAEYNPKSSKKNSRIVYNKSGKNIKIQAIGNKSGEKIKFKIIGI